MVDDLYISMYIQFEKSTTGAQFGPDSRVCFKQTIEPKLPFLFQNERLSPGSRGDFKANG